ncbi:MAG: sugar transferase [Geminicoccaceae bacterium]
MTRVPYRNHLVFLIDLGLTLAALPLAIILRGDAHDMLGDPAKTASIMVTLAVLSALCQVLLGTFRHAWGYIAVRDIICLIHYAILVALCVTFAGFLLFRLDGLARSIPVLLAALTFFGMLATRLTYRWSKRRVLRRPAAQPDSALLIGGGDGAALVGELLWHAHAPNIEVLGILDDDMDVTRTIAGYRVLGRPEALASTLARFAVQDMVVRRVILTKPQDAYPADLLHTVKAVCAQHGIIVNDLPDLVRLRERAPDGTQLSEDGDTFSYVRFKRMIDALVAFLLITLTAPLMLLTCAGVYAFVGRPIFFVQRRQGLGQKPFKLRKFRSMRDPIAADGSDLSDAERTPYVGRLLRRSRIDELPQLWNILIGDMSLIGPRPLLERDTNGHAELSRLRSEVRPGMTGWAQVNGGQQLQIADKFALDLYYIRHASLALDLRILYLTVKMILFGERINASAIRQAQDVLASS